MVCQWQKNTLKIIVSETDLVSITLYIYNHSPLQMAKYQVLKLVYMFTTHAVLVLDDCLIVQFTTGQHEVKDLFSPPFQENINICIIQQYYTSVLVMEACSSLCSLTCHERHTALANISLATYTCITVASCSLFLLISRCK